MELGFIGIIQKTLTLKSKKYITIGKQSDLNLITFFTFIIQDLEMTLIPLNKYELDFIISILKLYKIRITEEIKQQPLENDLEDRHYPNMVQNMINKLEKYWVEEIDGERLER